MGIQLPLPDHVANKIEPADRKKNKITTAAELIEKAAEKTEKAMQSTFWNFTRLKGITVDPSAMHKGTTRRKGMADFPCYYRGKVLFVEFKRPGNRLSKSQVEFRDEIQGQGFHYCVAYSASQAIEFAQKYLLNGK